jgi:hypothetical protein
LGWAEHRNSGQLIHEVYSMFYGEVVAINLNYLWGTDAVIIRHTGNIFAVYVEIQPSIAVGAEAKPGDPVGSTKTFNNSNSNGRFSSMLHLEVYLGRNPQGVLLRSGNVNSSTGNIIGVHATNNYYVTNRSYGRPADLIAPTGVSLLPRHDS